MLDEALNKCAENNNYTIYTSMCKAQRILMRSYDAVCSISGGSDSDIVLDLIHKVDEDGKVPTFEELYDAYQRRHVNDHFTREAHKHLAEIARRRQRDEQERIIQTEERERKNRP